MRERLEVDLAHLGEQIGETQPRPRARPQHQGVHEHADQRIEYLLSTPRDRGRHTHIIGRAQPAQQHRQAGMQHHERRHIPVLGDPNDPIAQRRGDLELDPSAPMGGDPRPRPVQRQFQHIGRTGQLILPVLQLAADDGLRVLGRPKDLVLPDREVGHLYVQRRQTRRLAGGPRRVRGHHVGDQRLHRLTIGRNMVDDQGEHELTLAGLPQPHPDRPLRAHVEALDHHGLDLLATVDHLPVETLLDRRSRGDVLERHPVDIGERGAQHLVPSHHIADRSPQGRHIQRARQAQHRGDVVRRQIRLEPVDKPHALLGEGQRHPIGARHHRGHRR